MRNFTQAVDMFSTFVLDDTTSIVGPTFVRIQRALVISMGANPESLTPSEEAVLADFIGWVRRCLEASCEGHLPTELAFVYHNLNEGHSVAVIWTDSKGKMVTPANQLALSSSGVPAKGNWADEYEKHGHTLIGFREGVPIYRKNRR